MLSLFLIVCLSFTFVATSSGDGGRGSIRQTLLSGHITEDTVFPSGIYWVTGTVTVDTGITVEFLNGSDVRFQSSTHYFVIYGKLILNGTQEEPVYFRHRDLVPNPGSYGGIIFMPGSSGLIDHAYIGDAVNGITIRGRGDPYVEIRYSEIAYCSEAGISVDVAHLVPSPTFPLQNKILFSTIRNCSVGIKDNGIDTIIQDCVIKDNTNYGIYLGHDPTYPKAPSAAIMFCAFRGNGGRYPVYGNPIYINGTDNPEDYRSIVIHHNNFFANGDAKYFLNAKGVLKNFRFESNTIRAVNGGEMYGRVENIRGGEITYNTFGNGTHLSISSFENLSFEKNYLYGFTRGLVVRNGENISFANNTFYESRMISQGWTTGALFSIDNVSNVSVVGNEVYNFTPYSSPYSSSYPAIRVGLSSPVWVYGNRIRGREGTGTGISAEASAYKGALGEVRIVNNTVENCNTGVSIGENKLSYIKDLRAFNCSKSIVADIGYLSGEMEGQEILIEDSMLINDTWSLYLDRHAGLETFTVHMKNTTYRIDGIYGSPRNTVVEVRQYLKVRTYDDLLRPCPAHVKISNVSGSEVSEMDIIGVSPLIEGPPLRYIFDEKTYDRLPSVNFTDVNLIYEVRGRGTWRGELNLTQYTELEVLLDGAPSYQQGPSELTFAEDSYLVIDPYQWFSDLDPIECQIVAHDVNLSIEGFNITTMEENWYGTAWVVVKATDSWGNFTEENLTVEVYPRNDAPEITPSIDDIFMDEDTTYTLNLSAHMYDVDGDVLRWSAEAGENLSIHLDNTTWLLTIVPRENFYGEDLLTLNLTDGQLVASIIVRVHVNPVNDPPVFNAPKGWNLTVEKGREYVINLVGYVSDVDSRDHYFVAQSDYAAVMGENLVILVPLTSTVSQFNVLVTVFDEDGANDSAVLTVFVAVHWNISSASVTVDEEGDWHVTVRGEKGLTVYIVIDGVGSFKLVEKEDGLYEVIIPGKEFTPGKSYSYHFSDREGGEDLSPNLSSEINQPGKREGRWSDLLLPLLIVLLIIVIIAAWLLLRRRGGGRRAEE